MRSFFLAGDAMRNRSQGRDVLQSLIRTDAGGREYLLANIAYHACNHTPDEYDFYSQTEYCEDFLAWRRMILEFGVDERTFQQIIIPFDRPVERVILSPPGCTMFPPTIVVPAMQIPVEMANMLNRF